MIRHLEQWAHNHNRQRGFFTHLALDAGCFSFIGFAPTARQHPERGPAVEVDDLQQQDRSSRTIAAW